MVDDGLFQALRRGLECFEKGESHRGVDRVDVRQVRDSLHQVGKHRCRPAASVAWDCCIRYSHGGVDRVEMRLFQGIHTTVSK